MPVVLRNLSILGEGKMTLNNLRLQFLRLRRAAVYAAFYNVNWNAKVKETSRRLSCSTVAKNNQNNSLKSFCKSKTLTLKRLRGKEQEI